MHLDPRRGRPGGHGVGVPFRTELHRLPKAAAGIADLVSAALPAVVHSNSFEVWPGAAFRQDQADRVRAQRRANTCSPGRRETRDVRLLGLHALLREEQRRGFLAQAEDHVEADAGQACRGQRPDQAPPASSHPGAGKVARQRGARTLRLLRRARQHRRRAGIPTTGDLVLVQGAAAPQPTNPGQLGPDAPHVNRWLPPARPMHPFAIVRFNVRTQGRSPVR